MPARPAAHSRTQAFVAAFAAFEPRISVGSPAWLRDARRAAMARFAAQGLPTSKAEDWKYTSLAPMEEALLDLTPAPAGERLLTEESLAPFLAGPMAIRLVFVNGRYSPKLSVVPALPAGVRAGSLAEAMISDGEMLRGRVIEATNGAADSFGALNTAFWEDGAFVHLPPGAVLEAPIHLVFVTTASGGGRVAHPRSVIVLERSSQATIMESYVALTGDPYLINALGTVALAENAQLEHCRVQREGAGAVHVGRLMIEQARDSRASATSIALGGRLVRNEIHVRLDGEGASAALHGLSVLGARQHVDVHTVVDHASPHGTSRQLFKGVLDGRARGVFDGRIIVRPGAQKTDAHQLNKNLLLSDGVEVDSKPQLEIFADDVKCSHGAADGQLAADALFYLKSRGLGEAAARALLTWGFASEVLGRIRADEVRAAVEALVAARLREGRVAEEIP
jgi:Fe-S cluster assembly protein SufD